jgi:hypothetical protein
MKRAAIWRLVFFADARRFFILRVKAAKTEAKFETMETVR